MEALQAFALKWCHPDYPPVHVEPHELSETEKHLGITFPADYKSAILAVGLPTPTMALLSGIVDHDIDLASIQCLYPPKEIVASTKGWQDAGLHENLIAIASDDSGNQFCFDINDLGGTEVPEATVYIWDHDFDETSVIAKSFLVWIQGYLGEWSNGLTYQDF